MFITSALAGAVAGVGAMNAPIVRAIEPIERTKGAHFKYSLAAYSYRDLLKGKTPKLIFPEARS